jgi:hypothetical protein
MQGSQRNGYHYSRETLDQYASQAKENFNKKYGHLHLKGRPADLAKYGLTMDDLCNIWEAVGGACQVCRQPSTYKNGRPRPLVLDHDHDTEKFRGLVCSNDNAAMGLLGDSSERAFWAMHWLLVHSDGLRSWGPEAIEQLLWICQDAIAMVVSLGEEEWQITSTGP